MVKHKIKVLYRDEAGNELVARKLKAKTQLYAKNRQGRVVNEKGFTTLLKESGLFKNMKSKGYIIEPTSAKGRRISKRLR